MKYSNIAREEPSKRVKDTVELLAKARVCHQVFHSHCTGIPLYAEINPNAYKLLFMDIGIANHICGNDWIFLESTDDRNLVNLWSELGTEHDIDLVVCIAAALRRGVKDEILDEKFRISGLGQLVEAGIQADRTIVFGD